MSPAICEIHHAQHTGGVLVQHTDYWYQAVVTDGAGPQVLAETPRRRTDRTRAAASREDLEELERVLRRDGWEPLAGGIDGLPRFQRPQAAREVPLVLRRRQGSANGGAGRVPESQEVEA